jgi:hypothetical protein
VSFSEDTAVFLEDFGLIAEVGSRRALVLLDAPDTSILSDRVLSTSYSMTFRARDLPDLKHGDWVGIDGVQYEVIQVNAVDDGVFKHALLQKT